MIETMTMGGAENLAVNIANTLADRGHDSHLIVIGNRGPLSDRIQPNVKSHHLDFHRASLRNPVSFLWSWLRGRRLLGNLVSTEKIDVVQTHLPGSNFWGLSLARDKVCAVLPTVHNNEEFNYGEIDNAALGFLRKSAYRQMLKSCHGVVAVSGAVRKSLLENLGLLDSASSGVAVVTNAVPLPPAISDADSEATRNRLGVSPGDVLILAAGRFCEQKNFRDLLPVAERLKSQSVPFRLVVAGDGELKQSLQERAQAAGLTDHLIMPGNIHDLPQTMLASDIFVMTSLWEGLPLVLLEAMAASLPVVAYSIPGITEVVEEGATGLMASPGDTDTLANRLGGLLADPSRRQAMGTAGKEIISSKFSFEILINELIGLYDSALASLGRNAR